MTENTREILTCVKWFKEFLTVSMDRTCQSEVLRRTDEQQHIRGDTRRENRKHTLTGHRDKKATPACKMVTGEAA